MAEVAVFLESLSTLTHFSLSICILADRKIISCTNVNKIKYLRKYLFKTKCKWENKVTGDTIPPNAVM
jgi:hypothetical protein